MFIDQEVIKSTELVQVKTSRYRLSLKSKETETKRINLGKTPSSKAYSYKPDHLKHKNALKIRLSCKEELKTIDKKNLINTCRKGVSLKTTRERNLKTKTSSKSKKGVRRYKNNCL